jgi:crossover junction endodeoxyribonuclease RuvC
MADFLTETPPRILGIDPGLSGAIAALSERGHLVIHDMPTLSIERGGKTKRTINAAALAGTIRELAPARAVIERVGAMPGQGVTSMFAFGRSLGIVEGIIGALNIPVSYVAPRTWQGALKVPKGKDGARLRASEMMPAYAALWHRKRDDGRADAALIALWGWLERRP